jgi:hypothetical protein
VRTNLLAKRLKTIGLHKNGTLDSQIESRKYEGWCRDVNGPKVILASHFAIGSGIVWLPAMPELAAEKSIWHLILGGAAVRRCDTQHGLELRL